MSPSFRSYKFEVFTRIHSVEKSLKVALNVNRLKDKARKFELKDQPEKAIGVYLQVVEGLEDSSEMDTELNLYNKIGDLYLKTNDVNAAVEMYERAAERYAESGLPNNAIALCNKILRTAPGRTGTYLMLGELMLQRGFGGEAKQYLIEYARRMSKAGRVEEAFGALKKFADASPDDQQVRTMLTEQLEAAVKEDPENEQLAQLFEDFAGEVRVRASRAVRQSEIQEAIEEKPAAKSGLVFIDLDADDETAPAEEAVQEAPPEDPEIEAAAPEVELSEPASLEADAEAPAVAGLDGLESAREIETGTIEPLEIETTSLDDSEAPAAAESLDIPELEIPELDTAGLGDVAEVPAAPERTVEALEAQLADNPDDGSLHRELAELLLEQGERERGIREFDEALASFERAEAWERARGVVDEILHLDPNSVDHHQKRVEYSYRNGEQSLLVGAYLGLGNALFRSGSLDQAAAVFERVLELDPENQDAQQALQTVSPVELEMTAPGAPVEEKARKSRASQVSIAGEGFVDLGALILDDEPELKDTRMVGEDLQTGDEQGDFANMLSQFKRGIEESIDDADGQAHYDLGVAFKEMGLLDEAIGEFQKAHRGEDMRLQSSEALGNCFFEKGQFQVAATVLRRAVDADGGSDQEKIGLLYLLGRCDEEQSKSADALGYYQRVFAVDINFQDVGQRVDALAKAGG